MNSPFDVVVVGSGAAGLCAALTAQIKGLRCLVLEKAPVIGGTTAISGGGLWIPDNPVARRQGIVDSQEAARTYIQHITGNWFDPIRTDALLSHGPEMVEFLEKNSDVQFFVAADRPDYYPDLPGASPGGRTIFPLAFDGRQLGAEMKRLRPPARELTFLGMMFKPGPDLRHFMNVFRSVPSTVFVTRRLTRHAWDLARHGRAMALSNGNALIARLTISALDAGVLIRTSTAARGLVIEDGRVRGVRIATEAGEQVIDARLGVVLASGGFPHDVARRRAVYPHAPTGTEHLSPAPPTNTGDGIRMAEDAGAGVPLLQDAAAWCPVSAVPHRNGTTGVFPHLIDRQKPGFIAVTRTGQRFVNEANSYHEFCRALAAACRDEPEAKAFLIADHATIRRYGMGFAKPAPVPLAPYIRSGYLLRGRTLRELAVAAGIDAEAFEQTIRAFNGPAREGRDPEFGKGETSYNRYNGDQGHRPNPCVAPVERPPFYAVVLRVGELGTFAGLATDERARVLDRTGQVIAGLYAAGNDMSQVMGGNYVGGGTMIGPGMTFGYIAACDLAAHQQQA